MVMHRIDTAGLTETRISSSDLSCTVGIFKLLHPGSTQGSVATETGVGAPGILQVEVLTGEGERKSEFSTCNSLRAKAAFQSKI